MTGLVKDSQRATIADLLAIPEEDRRHEIIDGVLVQQESASGPHGRAQGRICARLAPYERRPGARWPGGWSFAIGVEILFTETDVLRPDIAGWRRERMPEMSFEVPTLIRPDWVCEVLSKNQRNDRIKKRIYHRHQVGHYWIADPVEELFVVSRWHSDGYTDVLLAERDDRVRPEPFDIVEFRVATLFEDDDDE